MPPMNPTHKTRKLPGWRSGAVIATCLLLACSGGARAQIPAGHGTTGTSAAGKPTIDALLKRARTHDDATQAILVTADAANGPRATLAAYAYASGHWSKVMGPMPAVLGRNGISLHKREGDGKSPAGIFRMGRAFGSRARPDGVRLPYTRTTQYDYWVDAVDSPDYNHWETWFGDADERWASFERLRIPAYEYAAVIRYNMDPVRKGLGSAIFFHIWPGPDGHTAGCTAVSKQNVLRVLRWLDPVQQPVIIQGTGKQLEQLAKTNAADIP